MRNTRPRLSLSLERVYWAALIHLCFSIASSNVVVSKTEPARTVQCFCTAKDCGGPLCDGSWCLIGFKNDVDLVQRCATDQAKALVHCARKLNEWEEVCSCDSDFCNTFTYMRKTLKKYDAFRDAHPDVPNQFEGFDTSNLVDSGAKQLHEKSISPTKHLILLLVVVPLGIGAVTVCLVFLNYHCKM